jgi:tRNA pseudouridine55 synthase
VNAPPPGPAPSGMLLIDKPPGWTSMDVCATVRARLRRGGAPKRIRVGHTGTLDPFATGLLVVLIGPGTRLAAGLTAQAKAYTAVCDLSRTSTTDDPEGETTEVRALREPTRDEVEETARRFVGQIMQKPPAFSAVHVGGRRAYSLARAGQAPDLPARPVMVYSLRVVAYEYPALEFAVECGKGTYIRSLARDLGAALGCGGMLTALRRTASGPYRIEKARTVESLPERLGKRDLLPLPAGDHS